MSIDWRRYQNLDLDIPLDSEIDRWFRELSKRQADLLFDKLMSAKESRIEELRVIVSSFDLCCKSCSLEQLNSWYLDNLKSRADDPRRLTRNWTSVAFDIGLFFGDCLIEHAGSLKWEVCEEPDSLDFQMPVLVGFKNEGYYYNIIRRVISLGHRRLFYVNYSEFSDSLSTMQKQMNEPLIKKWKGKEHKYGEGKFLEFYTHVVERARQ